jgi:hypothetical protein
MKYSSCHFLSLGAQEQEAGLKPLTLGMMRRVYNHYAATADYKKELYSPSNFSLSMPGARAGLEPLTLGMVR